MTMRELIKPNVIKENFELVKPNCPELSMHGCPELVCICDNGSNNSILDEEDILF